MPRTYFLKRPLDIILATLGIFFLLPAWFLIIILIWLETKNEIFYLQERVGLNGRPFMIIKFYTLYKDKNNNVSLSRLGTFLRKTALDESLQLINILKGEMSFVGPRPLVYNEVARQPEISQRVRIKPGLTGLAQINIPKDSDIAEKFKHDLWYMRNQSLALDLKIILISFIISLKGKWESKKGEKFILFSPKI